MWVCERLVVYGARTFAFVHERDPDSDFFSVCVAFLISVSEESKNRISSGQQLLYLVIRLQISQ
jgi:hypothetical protein